MSGPLFAGQQAAFIALLRGLRPGQWARPTVCPGWDVKDIAAHVLGNHVGRLSRHGDGYSPLHPRDGEPFPAFLDRINAEWVTAARRLSPRLLIGQLSVAADQIAEFWSVADPDALGEPVSWAGPGPVPRPGWMPPGTSPSTGPTTSRSATPPASPGPEPRIPSAPSSTPSCGPCRTPCATRPPRRAPSCRWS